MELRKREQKAAEIPTSSMADIAFLLIIFFIVTTSFNKDKGMTLDLPRSEPEKTKKTEKNVTVTLSKTKIVLNDNVVKIGELRAKLDKALDKLAKTGKKRIVVLKSVDQEIRYGKWVRVVDTIKQAAGIITILIEED